MDKIVIEGLEKSFGGNPVLRGVSLTVQKGETMVVMGRSGCGKSVLLKHLVGLFRPDAGWVYVDGEEITQLPESDLYRIRTKFGMLFQGAALLDSLTVGENVGLGLTERSRLGREEIDCIVREKLSLVGMSGIQHFLPSDLSGGMKKRAGLARAIAMEPEIVLYDEPTTGLDPIMADTINELIIFLKHELRITSVVVTHDMTSARKVGDRFALLHEGVIVFTGTIHALDTTTNPTVRQFVEGRSETTIKAPAERYVSPRR